MFISVFASDFETAVTTPPLALRPRQRLSLRFPAPRRQWPKLLCLPFPLPTLQPLGARQTIARYCLVFPFIPSAFVGHNKLFKPLNCSHFLLSGLGMGAAGAHLGWDGGSRESSAGSSWKGARYPRPANTDEKMLEIASFSFQQWPQSWGRGSGIFQGLLVRAPQLLKGHILGFYGS